MNSAWLAQLKLGADDALTRSIFLEKIRQVAVYSYIVH